MAGHVAPISRDFSGNQPLKSGVVQFICSDDAWKFLRFEPEAFCSEATWGYWWGWKFLASHSVVDVRFCPSHFVVGVRFSATHFVVRLWPLQNDMHIQMQWKNMKDVLWIFLDIYGFMAFYGFLWSGLERKTLKWLPSFGEQGFNWGTCALIL